VGAKTGEPTLYVDQHSYAVEEAASNHKKQKTFHHQQITSNRFSLFKPTSVQQDEVAITHEKKGTIDPLKMLHNVAILKMEP
jgi:hypothetical protein